VSFVVIIGLAVLNIVGGSKQLRAGDIRSLVILPFENYTGEDQFENMVSSMHSLLCGDMGRISGLRVIGKTTSKIYKEVDMSAKDIARELNVDAVVEATVMCLGDTVCMQFSLISTTGEEHQIWIGDYREDKGQILNLYNRITKQIAKEVKIELSVDEERLLAKSRTVDREAYDAYLMGSYYLDDGSKESLMKAREYLNSAIEKDPEWAPLYAGLTMVWLSIGQMGYEPPEIVGPKIFENLNKALELDPDLADSHEVNGMMAYLIEWDWEKSEKEFLKALAINPNDAQTRIIYAHLLSILQRPGEALTQGQLAIDLDPLNPLIQVLYSALLVSLDDCETALAYLEKVVAKDPEHVLAYGNIEYTAYRCKDYNKAFEAVIHILPLEEDSLKEIEAIFDEHGFVAAYEEIMHHMETVAHNGTAVPIEMAFRYVMANQYDKAMDWVEKGYELHDQNMPYIATSIYNLDPLHDNPRFIAIVEKMNLPLPNN
jgi:TolB-like protein